MRDNGDASYLLPAELAAHLKLSKKTIYRLAAQDPTMPVLRIGGSVRFPRGRLETWLRAREQGPGRPRRRAAGRTDEGAR